MMETPRLVLTIAGSDSSGGAGIQADIKTFEALGCFGMSVITAVTAQNTREICSVQIMTPEMVSAQMEAVLPDIGVKAIKTGMLANADIVRAVSKRLHRLKVPLVVDPVMIAKAGTPLLSEDAVQIMMRELLPQATLITPNIPEAKILSDGSLKKIARIGKGVLLKGGHRPGKIVRDQLFWKGKCYQFQRARIETKNTHGSGCVLSAAIAARLAQGDSLLDAVRFAENFMERAIRFSLPLGKGCGPVYPMATLRNEAGRWRALQGVRNALEVFERENIRGLIPEVGSQFVVATPYAMNLEEVAGVEGRITRTKHGIQTSAGSWFGVSTHVARLLLAIRSFDSGYLAAMNIRYSPEIVSACRRLRLRGATFDRRQEPKSQRSKEGRTLLWAVGHLVTAKKNIPDYFVDLGAVGKEAMIRLVARSPNELIKNILKINFEQNSK